MEKGSNFLCEGIHVGQVPGIQNYFKMILKDFDRIIEIGTDIGGLTLFIHLNKKDECELISYDILESINKVPKKYKIDFRIGDCFSEKTFNEIKNLIIEPSKRILLLCDGGNKNREFNTFCKFIKPNDVIMCHDFSESPQDFTIIKDNTGWIHSSESDLQSINESINKYNLDKFHYNEFKSVIWGSFIKK